MIKNMERQLELEKTMSDLGEIRYRDSVEDASQDFNSVHIQKVVADIITPFADILEKENNAAVTNYRGKGKKAQIHKLFMSDSAFKKKFNIGLDCDGEKLYEWNYIPLTTFQVAFIVLRSVFSRLRDDGSECVNGRMKQNNFSIEIGRTLSSNLVDTLSNADMIHYGSMLVRVLVANFPEWFVHTVGDDGTINVPYDWFDSDSKNKEYIIEPSEHFIDYCDELIDAIAEITMTIMPMIAVPCDWDDNGHGGGFYSDNLKRNIIKGRGLKKDTGVNADIAKSVNVIQSTPWRVNKFMFNYMISVQHTQPPTLKKVFPKPITADVERPFSKDVINSGDLTEEQKKKITLWKFRCEKFKNDKQARRSRILSREAAMKQAEQFLNEEVIYFPHDLDYRDRLYNMCMTGLNTQGSDVQKALIQLGNSRPIVTTKGIRWMKINMANLMGEDKARLNVRVKFTEDNEDLLIRTVADPVGNTEWHSWDKPLQGLAFAEQYVKWLNDPLTPLNLHIQLDGLCNGVQNLAAITRDEKVAPHVGLVPTEDRGDVYQYVCDGVVIRIGTTSTQSIEWLHSDLMCRALTKTPVMTRSYGAKLYGIKDGVKDYIDESDATDLFENMMVSANWMGDQIWETMAGSLSGPMEFMEWVQKCAGILAKHNLPLKWKNPIGMNCIQSPMKDKPKRVSTKLNGKTIQYYIREKINKIDKGKAEASSSPNVIHSCDASHLISTTLLCILEGITNFAMVHDSFGCHPDDAQTLLDCTKKAWVEMYKTDWMDVWYKGWCHQLIIAGFKSDDMPKPPKKGTLDITAVMKSDFFFA
jgi:DNA-directed RNA polymerase